MSSPITSSGLLSTTTKAEPSALEPKQRPVAASSEPAPAPANALKEALPNTPELVNKILQELNKDSAQGTLKQLERSMGLDTNELKALAKELKEHSSPKLQALAAKLNELIKPVSELSHTSLASAIFSSGIAYEAKLANAVQEQLLPAQIKQLFASLKNLSNQEMFNKILALAAKNIDNEKAFDTLENMLSLELKNAAQKLNASGYAKFFSLAQKLENAAKYLSQKAAQPLHADMAKKLSQSLLELVKKAATHTKALSQEKGADSPAFVANQKQFQAALDGLKDSMQTLEKMGSKAQYVDHFSQLLSSHNKGESLQDMLRLASRRLSAMLKALSPSVSEARRDVFELKKLAPLIKAAKPALAKLKPQDIPAALARASGDDIKSTLLAIKNELSSQNASASLANSLHGINRAITGIELQQIFSFLNSELGGYLPYFWDNVDRSRLAFKRGKKDSFHAKIELNFKKYGQVGALLSLSNSRYIDISLSVQSHSLKQSIDQDAAQLKKNISQNGLIISSFKVRLVQKRDIASEFASFGGVELGLNASV